MSFNLDQSGTFIIHLHTVSHTHEIYHGSLKQTGGTCADGTGMIPQMTMTLPFQPL